MSDDKPYPKGTRVICVRHSGRDGFWQEHDTPDVGELCTIKAAIKIDGGRYVYQFYEYQQEPNICFHLMDFEPFTGKIKIINEQPTVETKDRKPIP